MEKILEFKKDRHNSVPPSKYYRFQCDCLTPSDAMDIEVESVCNDDSEKYFTIEMNFVGTGFWGRVKYAFQILRGKWAWREFIPRNEDYKNLSDLFNPDIKFNDLP